MLSRPGCGVVLAAAGLFASIGCGGVEGTVQIALTTAPGSTVLDEIALARLTLSDPPTVVEASRGADGTFALVIDVVAEGSRADLTFEGFDGAGERVAYGKSGSLAIAAFDAAITVYVAAPGSLAAAPVTLDPPRQRLGTAAFPFGVLVAGGVDAGGATSDTVQIYNLYQHAWQNGLDLPAPRAGLTIGGSGSGFAYLFGGTDAAGDDTGTLWQFDTTVAPAGAFRVVSDSPTLARSSAAIALVATEGFVVTGAPPVVIDGITLTATAATTLPALSGTATSLLIDGGAEADRLFATFVGDGTGTTGVVRVGADISEEPAPASARRTGHGAVPASNGRVVVLGGAVAGIPTATALVIDPVARTVVEQPDLLATPRRDAAIAASGGRIVVAGGVDASGTIVPTAEIFDDVTLARLAVVPLVVARTGAVARPLANGQILIAGGVDGDGDPIATLELFTPDP